MEDSGMYSKEILERIREMAKRRGGEMTVVYRGGGGSRDGVYFNRVAAGGLLCFQLHKFRLFDRCPRGE